MTLIAQNYILMSIDGQKLHKNMPFIARKVAKKLPKVAKKKLQKTNLGH